MKLHTLIITTALSLLSLSAAHAAAPINDSAVNAIEAKGSYQLLPLVNFSTATAAATDPLISGANPGKTVWYKLPRTVNLPSMTWLVDVVSSTGSGVAAIYVQQDPDNPLSSLALYQSTSFAPGQAVSLSANTSTKTCMLMVGGSGSVQVRHRLSTVENDFPDTADVLTGARGTVMGDNSEATMTADEPALPAGIEGKNLVWYKWTPTFSGAAAVDTNFSFRHGPPESSTMTFNSDNHITMLALYQQTSPGVLAPIAGDDNSGWFVNSRIDFTAVSGATYYVAVGTLLSSSGQFQLNYYRANTAGELFFFDGYTGTTAYPGEELGSCPIVVARRYAGNFATSSTLATASGSATAGSDFQAINTTLSFPIPSAFSDSAWAATATLSLVNDVTDEAPEYLTVTLSNPSGGATIPDSSKSISIGDDDTPPSAFDFTVDAPELRVSESTGTVYTKLRRNHIGSSVDILRQVIMTGVTTATAGADFTFTDRTFVSQSSAEASLTTNIVNDSIFEGEERIWFSLNTPGFPDFKIIVEDDDPFIPAAGRLSAALQYGSRISQCYAVVSSTGTVTGKLAIMGRTIPFVTKLDLRGKASVVIPMTGRGSLLLQFEARNAYGNFYLKLFDSQTNGSNTVSVVLQNYSALLNPCPEAGRYTGNGKTNEIGIATTISVNTLGDVIVAGKLFDGTGFTIAGYIDGVGRLSATASLYANQGCVGIYGDLPLLDGQSLSLSTLVTRPARAGDPTKLGATSTASSLSCLRYTPAVNVRSSLDCWGSGTGKATLTGGPLMNTLTKALTVNLTSITPPVDAEKLKLSIVPSTGVFSGSFVLPGTTKVLPFYGVLSDLPGLNGSGTGYFFDGLKTGKIVIGQP